MAQRGTRRRLTEMATENARESLDMLRVRWLADSDRSADDALTQLHEELDLPTLPRRIECYDNSNIQGTSPVASMVVFIDGKPTAAEYRRFKIKTVEGANDFASMAEILRRRFDRFKRAGSDGVRAFLRRNRRREATARASLARQSGRWRTSCPRGWTKRCRPSRAGARCPTW